MEVIPIDKNVSFNEASCTIVNPFTVASLYEIAKDHDTKTVVHTAAAS
jgi:NADPH2:quinone reductase